MIGVEATVMVTCTYQLELPSHLLMQRTEYTNIPPSVSHAELDFGRAPGKHHDCRFALAPNNIASD